MTLRQAPFGEAQDRQGERFGESAAILAGIAARLLGWRPGEFWEATPAELASGLQADEVVAIENDELSALLARFPDGGE